MPFSAGERVEASTVLGWVPAVVAGVYPADPPGLALYAVEPDPLEGGFPRLLLGAAHLRPADWADVPHLVAAVHRP